MTILPLSDDRNVSLPRLLTIPACCTALLAFMACKSDEPKAKAVETSTAAARPAPVESPKDPVAPTGTVRVLSADASKLHRPTTAAIVGQTVWTAIGQLSALFTEGVEPQLPFSALALPLAGGQFAEQSIALPGSDYYPEGITDAADGTLFIGSIMRGEVMKVAPGSNEAVPFLVKSATRRGVIGLEVDETRQLLWFCDSNPKLPEDKKAGDLVGVKLSDATEVVRHSLSKAGDKAPFCNDVIVGPDGSLWITESVGGRVFHVPPQNALEANSAAPWLSGGAIAPPDGGFGANGIEWMDGALIVANVGRGTLVAVDPKSPNPADSAHEIALVDKKTHTPMTLCSPDGLARVPSSKNKFVVVENGGCKEQAPRIIEVTLN